jgi:arabinogalactan endo-1,4-beta-galactosidase
VALLSSTRPVTVRAQVKPAAPSFIHGADISALSSIEQRGTSYRDAGKSDDAIAIFTRHGWNCFRLRIFVNPNDRGGVVNSLEYTRALAKRIKASGASFMLDFHYSDTWADPQHQVKPAAWKDMSFDEIEKQVERYTAEVMKDLKDNGVPPQVVQIGNEITGGTLWPDAQVQVPESKIKVFDGAVRVIKPPEPYDDAKQWDHLARVVKAGVRGVRASTTPADGVRTMLHIDCGGDWPVTKWFFDHMIEHGVEFEMIGQSYYPNWHGTIENVRETLRETSARYRKDIVIVETAYPWKNADYWSARKNMVWPVSPDGQKQFISELIKVVRETPNGRGVGVVYWHPESVASQGRGAWQGGAMALFDNDGNALPAMDALEP